MIAPIIKYLGRDEAIFCSDEGARRDVGAAPREKVEGMRVTVIWG
jgi:hypothetical protein